nr:MAG TPA: minor tail protein [Caudoviricetes sp.]
MANDSVGKISLDLELQSDIDGQLNAIAGKIGSQIEKSLKKASGAMDAEKVVQGMHQEIEALMQNISRVIDAALKRCTESAKMNIDIIGEHLNAMIDRAMARITNVLNPYSQTEEPTDTADSKSRLSQPRAPPVVKVKAPAVKIEYSKDMLEAQMEQIDQVTMNIGKQIDLQEAKLAELKAAYERTFNEAKKNRIQEQIIKTEGSIISLKGKLQDLGFQYDALEKKAALLQAPATAPVQAPKRVNAAPNISGLTDMNGALDYAKMRTMASAEQINQALSMVGRGQALSGIQAVKSGVASLLKTIGSGLVSGAKSAASAIGRLFRTIGNGLPKIVKAGTAMTLFGIRAKKAGNQSQSAQGGIHRMLTTMLRYQIIIPIIMSALRGMAKSLFASMNANEQFKTSLGQIRSNLNVAFTPIYQAVMPALNALMSALARVTGYIAAFVSLLFGKTLSGSVEATKSLVAAKTAMGAYGDSAKKAAKDAKGLTTGIDELNILQANKDDSGGGGGGEAPEITAPDIDTTQMGLIDTMAEKVKSVLGQLFKPLRDSWEAEGQNTINAAQYAFSNVIGLTQAMGRSFLEVWTNGTGERTCTNILRLVTLVFNMVGDIAGAFKRAWEEGGRGDAVIQSIFDRLNSWLELIHTIGESLRDVWNSGTGESVIGHILDSFTNINETISHIRENFRKAWELDNTGTDTLQNLADIIDGLLGSIERITSSLADWSSTLDFTPIMSAFERMSEALKPLGDKLGAGLEWLFKNVLQPLGKWALEEAIPAALDGITEALGLLNSILDSLKPAGEWLWKNFLEPISKWMGSALVDDLRGISDALKTVNDVLSGTSQLNPKEIFDSLMGGISRFNPLKPMMDLGKAMVDGIIEGIKSRDIMAGVREAFNSFLTSVKDFFGIHSPSTVFAEIGEYLIKGLINGIVGGWSGLIESIQDLPGQLTELFRSGYEGVQNVFAGIGDWFGGKWGEVKNALNGVPSWFSEKFTSARTKVSESFQSIGSWFSERYTDVTTAFKNSPTWFKNTFNDAYKKLTGVIQPIGGWFTSRYQDVQNAFKDTPTWFQTTFQSAYDNLTTAVSPIGGWFGDRYVDVQKAFEKSPEWFKTTFESVTSNVQTVFNGLIDFINKDFTEGWTNAWNGVKEVFRGVFNGVVELLESAMNYVISGINSVLNGLNDIASAVGDVIGLELSVKTIEPIKLKRLAQGGYVGANQPQLAMIGDNRHYGEIVAPEDKMQAMVDKAVAMAARPDSMSEQYLMIMIDLLKKIIELIENFDLVVNIDIRELRQKLKDLEKRSGFSFG